MSDAAAMIEPRSWRTPLYWIGYYVLLPVFMLGAWITCGVVALSAALGRPARPVRLRRRIQALLRAYISALQRFCGLRFRYPGWPADWESQVEGCLLVANHPSQLDAPLLLAKSANLICLYKSALERSFLPPAITRRLSQ